MREKEKAKRYQCAAMKFTHPFFALLITHYVFPLGH
jgi:hypothetical protein